MLKSIQGGSPLGDFWSYPWKRSSIYLRQRQQWKTIVMSRLRLTKHHISSYIITNHHISSYIIIYFYISYIFFNRAQNPNPGWLSCALTINPPRFSPRNVVHRLVLWSCASSLRSTWRSARRRGRSRFPGPIWTRRIRPEREWGSPGLVFMGVYPLVMTNMAIENGPVEIVDLPS